MMTFTIMCCVHNTTCKSIPVGHLSPTPVRSHFMDVHIFFSSLSSSEGPFSCPIDGETFEAAEVSALNQSSPPLARLKRVLIGWGGGGGGGL